MQTECRALYGRHQRTQFFQNGWDKKVQHEAAETARVALTQSFMAYGDELERVEVFKYLGWLLAYDDNDTQAMQGNLKKARKSWGQDSCILRAENTSPKVCGVFYKATVHAVLLFGSETWKLSPSSLKSLEGFHIWAAHCIVGKMPTRIPDGTLRYPSSRDVLKAGDCGRLDTILVFVGKSLPASLWTNPICALSGLGKEEGFSALHILVGAAFVNRRRGVTAGGKKMMRVMIPNFVGDNLLGGLLVWVVLNPY
jgi:hypothetical protein